MKERKTSMKIKFRYSTSTVALLLVLSIVLAPFAGSGVVDAAVMDADVPANEISAEPDTEAAEEETEEDIIEETETNGETETAEEEETEIVKPAETDLIGMETEEESDEAFESEDLLEESDVAYVSDWSELKGAIEDSGIRVIEFTDNISRTDTGTSGDIKPITRSLIINGNNFRLAVNSGRTSTAGLKVAGIRLGQLTGVTGETVLEINDLEYEKTHAPAYALFETEDGSNARGWSIAVNNVRSTSNSIAGFINVSDADVSVAGSVSMKKNGAKTANHSIIHAESIVIENGTSFIGADDGTSGNSVLTADGDLIFGENTVIHVSKEKGGSLFSAKNIEIAPTVQFSDLIGSGSGSVINAERMTIPAGMELKVRYLSPASNPSALLVDHLTLEKDAELIVETDGAAYGFYGQSFIMETGSSADFAATGQANAAMYMTDKGRVLLDPGSSLKIRSTEGARTDSATSAAGIYGKVSEFIARDALVDILVEGWVFRTTIECNVLFSEGAQIKLRTSEGMALGLYDKTGDGASAHANNVTFTDEGTMVYMQTGNEKSSAKNAAMYLRGHGSSLNVLDGAVLEIIADGSVEITDEGDDEEDDDKSSDSDTNNNSALQVQGDNAVIRVANRSVVKLYAGASKNRYSPVMRFRYVGNMTLEVDNAEMHVESAGGRASTARLYGNNNTFRVVNGGHLYIKNPGNGTPRKGGGAGYNTAIHFVGGNSSGTNTFEITGEGSAVELIAESGPAIYASNAQITKVTMEKGTIFEAYGHTKGGTAANPAAIIDVKNRMFFTMNEPAYFDFKNANLSEPAMDAAYNASLTNNPSTFSAANTVMAMWQTGTDWNGQPTISLAKMERMLVNGRYFKTIQYGSAGTDLWAREQLMEAGYDGISNYNRISANNARPIVDELRIPTDADQNIYGHISVPEGRAQVPRDAREGEVFVLVDILENGERVYNAPLKGITGTYDIFNTGDVRDGMFEIELPDGDYLKEGQEVRVLLAWSGRDADTVEEARADSFNMISQGSDIKVSSRTVEHVVPPAALSLENIAAHLLSEAEDDGRLVLSSSARALQGTSEEIGAHVYVYLNEILINNGEETVGEDGKWSVALHVTLEEGDIVSIALNDKSASERLEQEDQEYLGLWTIRDGGNQNPSQMITFHNSTFAKRLDLEVVNNGDISIVAPEILDFGSQGISWISGQHKVAGISEGDLGVFDTRRNKTEWSVYLTLEKELTHTEDSSMKLEGAMIYKYQGDDMVLEQGNAERILNGQNEQGQEFYDIYANNWYESGNGDGLYLQNMPGLEKVGTYEAQLRWTLMDVPGN